MDPSTESQVQLHPSIVAGLPRAGAVEAPSVLVLAKNDQIDIAHCLQTLSFSDDIVVLDAQSTDRTVEIAGTFPNVRVVQRAWDSEQNQINFGLREITYKHPWLYLCKADERVTDDLAKEMIQSINSPSVRQNAFRLRYKSYFLSHWIKHTSGYPKWIVRLVRPALASCETTGKEAELVSRGSIGNLQCHFEQYSFSQGLKTFFREKNIASTQRATETVDQHRGIAATPRAANAHDALIHWASRRHYPLLARSFWKFLEVYIIRGAWLDAAAGFHYAAMMATEAFWTEIKVHELQQNWSRQTEQTVEDYLSEDRYLTPR